VQALVAIHACNGSSRRASKTLSGHHDNAALECMACDEHVLIVISRFDALRAAAIDVAILGGA
jgi:hypothetical protein